MSILNLMTNMKSVSQADREAEARDRLSEDLVSFAWRMRTVPRKAQRCEIYGTVSAVVDRDHALNILRKAFPGYRIDAVIAYRAFNVLQERLDERQAA